jgi:hypothetical protein
MREQQNFDSHHFSVQNSGKLCLGSELIGSQEQNFIRPIHLLFQKH